MCVCVCTRACHGLLHAGHGPHVADRPLEPRSACVAAALLAQIVEELPLPLTIQISTLPGSVGQILNGHTRSGEGLILGVFEGETEGGNDGIPLGISEASAEGDAVGEVVGSCEGELLGLDEGNPDGDSEGT